MTYIKSAALAVDPIGHEQLVELDVSGSQTGVSWCVVPLHTPGIGPMCLERCKPFNCSVVSSIRNAAGQEWF